MKQALKNRMVGGDGVPSAAEINTIAPRCGRKAHLEAQKLFFAPPAPEPRGSVFVLTLQARPGVAGVRALKWLLKTLGRQHGFRCLDVREDARRGRA